MLGEEVNKNKCTGDPVENMLYRATARSNSRKFRHSHRHVLEDLLSLAGLAQRSRHGTRHAVSEGSHPLRTLPPGRAHSSRSTLTQIKRHNQEPPPINTYHHKHTLLFMQCTPRRDRPPNTHLMKTAQLRRNLREVAEGSRSGAMAHLHSILTCQRMKSLFGEPFDLTDLMHMAVHKTYILE